MYIVEEVESESDDLHYMRHGDQATKDFDPPEDNTHVEVGSPPILGSALCPITEEEEFSIFFTIILIQSIINTICKH